MPNPETDQTWKRNPGAWGKWGRWQAVTEGWKECENGERHSLTTGSLKHHLPNQPQCQSQDWSKTGRHRWFILGRGGVSFKLCLSTLKSCTSDLIWLPRECMTKGSIPQKKLMAFSILWPSPRMSIYDPMRYNRTISPAPQRSFPIRKNVDNGT